MWARPECAVRAPVEADRQAIATLLLDAYRGTIDDEGEGEDEALDAAGYFLSRCVPAYSLLVVHGERVVAVSLVVVVNALHYIDPVATAAAHKGAGLGRAAVAHSIALLSHAGVDEVGAVVTDGNVPSERLFASLGFERVGAWG